MGAAIAITLLFVAGETVAAIMTRSLALYSDAGHNFADALALGFSWYAMWIAGKPSDPQRTYGYHRVAILAALVNALALVVIALGIFFAAAQRLRAPQPIPGGLMAVVALVAIAVNGVVAAWLHHDAGNDVNVRSAYLHMLGDAASAAGVVIAGLLIMLTGHYIADPIASILIGALILYSSWGILKETVNVLLEGSPAGLNMRALESTINGVQGVLNVHDLHVWTVGPGIVACSCHVVLAEQSLQSGQCILRHVVSELEHHYSINHTTVQIEVEGCEPNHTYCRMEPGHGARRHHHRD
jgi:cobalt-zinc-cadmium efflux system protein